MTDRTRFEHTLGVFDAKTKLAITTETHALAAVCEGNATIVLRTGECWLQTYATADQCRAMANSLLAAAVDLDTIAQERQPMPEAA